MAKKRKLANRDVALEIARERFGYRSLRHGQREAIDFVLAGRDVVAVMPTGSGKSAIYQIPAVALAGPTIVVSPLIALQKDQAETLQELDTGGAAVVNSATPAGIRKEAFADLEGGDLEFLFLTPEQLAKPEIIDTVRAAEPSLFVVDEAHCISEWGHDFRPEYLRLGEVIEGLGHPQVLALTATAGEQVRNEIITRLGMRDPAVVVHGFDRPNIHLATETFASENDKLEALLRRVDWATKPGIVYVASRKHAVEVATAISERGASAFAFHGGMSAKQRAPLQDDFMADKFDVIVATSAFGMGVDKPNVRFVFHYDTPHSIDAYYQEIGRAGRDGEPAEALLFYRPEDLRIHKFFAGGSRIAEDQVQRFVEAFEDASGPLDEQSIKDATGLSKAKILRLLSRLSEMGAVECTDQGVTLPEDKAHEAAAIIEEAATEEERLHQAELGRIDRMRAYAELLSCRREYLLSYFGEKTSARCEFCDNCERTAIPAVEREAPSASEVGREQKGPPLRKPVRREEQAEDASPEFPPHTRVFHPEWGLGIVRSIAGDGITILFDTAGDKTLSLRVVRERHLLEKAS
jgi:ATP-dependent DNA helicase RecQ